MRLRVLLILAFIIMPCALSADDDNKTTCENNGYYWLNNAHYPATYSFTLTPNSTVPTNWSLFGNGEAGYAHGYVIDQSADRGKVFEFYDNDLDLDHDLALITTNYLPTGNGNISFWIRMSDPGNDYDNTAVYYISEILTNSAYGASCILVFGNVSLNAVNIDSQVACAESLTASQTIVGSIVKDQWHYINIEFDNTTSNCLITLDTNSPVACGLYDSWGSNGATGFLFATGSEYVASGSENNYILIDAINFDWTSQNYNSTIAQCCGDDGVIENFYNGTLGVNAYQCVNGVFDYFDIIGVVYDNSIDLTDELLSIYVSITSNTSPIGLTHINISNAYGPVLLGQNLTCSETSPKNYNCVWNTSVTDWQCTNHNGVIYREDEANHYNISFMIDDLISAYLIPQDTFITTNQSINALFSYCSGRTDYENINVKARLNGFEIINSNSSPTGNNFFLYANPFSAGLYNLTITANDTSFWSFVSQPINIVKTSLSINPELQVYKQNRPGFRSAYIELFNPSSQTQHYTITVIPADLNLMYSGTRDLSINLTLPPYSRAIKYLDVLPLIAGVYNSLIEFNSSLPADNGSIQFTAVVQTIYQRGLFTYTMTPGLNELSIITLLVIVSAFLIQERATKNKP